MSSTSASARRKMIPILRTIGAGFFLSSFIRMANVDTGLDPQNVNTLWICRRSRRVLEPSAQRSPIG
jgi:hypothetical protein